MKILDMEFSEQSDPRAVKRFKRLLRVRINKARYYGFIIGFFIGGVLQQAQSSYHIEWWWFLIGGFIACCLWAVFTEWDENRD